MTTFVFIFLIVVLWLTCGFVGGYMLARFDTLDHTWDEVIRNSPCGVFALIVGIATMLMYCYEFFVKKFKLDEEIVKKAR